MSNITTKDMIIQASTATNSKDAYAIEQYLKSEGYCNIPNTRRISRIVSTYANGNKRGDRL